MHDSKEQVTIDAHLGKIERGCLSCEDKRGPCTAMFQVFDVCGSDPF